MKNQNNNYEIVDLILPDTFNKEKAKLELLQRYCEHRTQTLVEFQEWFQLNAPHYIKELDEILNTQPKYDREFWEKVEKLNKENFKKISIQMDFSAYYDFKKIYFNNDVKENNHKSSSYFDLHELDLINKQYRLLQEIYYSRLEGAKKQELLNLK
jgi:hypothetical protein